MSNLTEQQAEHAREIFFLFLDFLPEAFYACTGTSDYDWGGETWFGLGEIGAFSEFAEASDTTARPLTVSLTASDATIATVVNNRTNYKNRAARVYRGYLNADYELVADPDPIWVGRMDVGSMVESDSEVVVQFSCEPLAARLIRPRLSRMSIEDHQLRWPTDRFFEFQPALQSLEVRWGGQAVRPGPIPGIDVPPQGENEHWF